MLVASRPSPRALSSLLPTSSAAARRALSSTPGRAYARTTLIGRLVAPPESGDTSQGKQYIRYSVATSQGSGDAKVTSFFRVASFPRDGASEAGIQFLLGLPKGTLVHVEADTRLRLADDPDTGKKVPRLDLVQKSIEVLARPRNQQEAESETLEE